MCCAPENSEKIPQPRVPSASTVLCSAALHWRLSRDQIARLEQFVDLFHAWNSRFGFSAYTTPDDITLKAVIPSLALGHLVPPSDRTVDLGTGPGIPGIPLKILHSDLKLLCIEASARMVEFLKALRLALGLEQLEILEGRAEEVAHDGRLRQAFDSVIARSFAPLPVLIEISSAFARIGGLVTVQCSGRVTSAARSHDLSLMVGSRFLRVGAIAPPQESVDPLYFIQFVQIVEPSDEYPRSWKQMKMRPLGT